MARKYRKFGPLKKTRLLDLLRDGASIWQAAPAADVTPECVYRARRVDPAFKEACDAAEKEGEYAQLRRMEAEADRRAIDGWDEPRFYEGEVCGYVRKFSDTLLMFRMKALAPDKYAERTKTETELGPNTRQTVADLVRAAPEPDDG